MNLLKSAVAVFAALWLGSFPLPGLANEAGSALKIAQQLNEAFVEVAQKVSPAVVVVNVLQKPAPVADKDEGDGNFDSLPPGFWKRFHEQFPQGMPTRGQGSGVIVRPNGFILTNRHVVEDADTIEVRLQDGRTFKGVLRGVDPQSDVAVIKIEAEHLPVARLADSSKVRVGEFAVAIGAPFSLDYSVTFGHVSAKGRSNIIPAFEGGGSMDQDFIQTDANINPGNSGGPLVNINGDVIGINTLIHGLHTGIGFAIPSNLAREVSEALIDTGKFTRAWLGIGIRSLREDAELRELIKGVEDGVVVGSILPEGPAAKSDLKPSDVIVAVDGRKVSTPQQLRAEVRRKKIGHPITLDVFRKGRTTQIDVMAAEWEQPKPAVAAARKAPAEKDPTGLGVKVDLLTKELASQFRLEVTEGVVVTSVEKNSPAARRGLQPGDIITSINQQAIKTPNDFREAMDRADLKKGVIVNLINGNTARFEVVKDSAE
jgi:serine protease Do